jgi:ribosomal protein L19
MLTLLNLKKKNNLNLINLQYFLLYKKKKQYLSKYFKYFFFSNIRIGNVIFIEILNYEFLNFRKYFFLGLCIAIKCNNINSSIILRNVIGKVMIEQQFLIFNVLILSIRKSKKRIIKLGFKKNKLFFLKNLPFFFRINKLVINETFFYSNKKIKKKKKKKFKI